MTVYLHVLVFLKISIKKVNEKIKRKSLGHNWLCLVILRMQDGLPVLATVADRSVINRV